MQDGSLSLCMLCALLYCQDRISTSIASGGWSMKVCNLQSCSARSPALLIGQEHKGVTCTRTLHPNRQISITSICTDWSGS